MYRKIINYLTRKDRLISELIIDRYFGIYNRNGFEYILSNLDDDMMCITLVDFNSVKEMNKKHGYKKVNEIFTSIFNELKDNFIIGRAFSGDEIFFYSKNGVFDVETIITTSKKYDLELENVFKICNSKNITNQLEMMIDELHFKTLNK
jgi:hypothetical protein